MLIKNRYAVFSVCLLCAHVAAGNDIDFARDIRPILNAKCVECHGGVKAAGGVSFVYQDRVIDHEADSGEKVVVPGEPDESELIRRIHSDDESEVMPPPESKHPLTDEEKTLIMSWVREGAVWGANWSFTPLKRPEIPSEGADHNLNPIDRFLIGPRKAANLQSANLKAANQTPKNVEQSGRLLRRLSIAITGLPPTLDEYAEFEKAIGANRDKAIENKVDELLGSDAFGERWASMWLDLVRYADSGGLGLDQKRTIWLYRDWVIRAFNADMPFDEFTIKQLAGDLLPNPTTNDLIATACQRNTQTNNEGGTDDETFRVEAVVDRINTTWQTWGSLTFGCTQCHDHPYDPLRNQEYYEFMDFYNNSADSDLPNDAPLLRVPNDSKKIEESAELRKKILTLKKSIWEAGKLLTQATDWRYVKRMHVEAQNESKYAVDQTVEFAEYHTVGTVATKTQTHIKIDGSHLRELVGEKPVTALRLTMLPHQPESAKQNPEWGFVITGLNATIVSIDKESGATQRTPIKFSTSVPDVAWMPDNPLQTIDPNGKNWGANSRIHHTRTIALIPVSPISLTQKSKLEIQILCDKTGHGSHPMVVQRGRVEVTDEAQWNEITDDDSDLQRQRSKLAELTTRIRAIPATTVPIMSRRPDHLLRPTHIFGRGNAMEKEDQVHAALPDSLTRVAPIGSDSPDRLEMANWWASKKNPLTARVFANRVWAQLFGTGIVRTIEDFGSSGEKPVHPALLDYLASRFQDDYGWSVKSLIREIVLSDAFLQSSAVSDNQLESDPANRLLARAPRLRLNAESIRDHALAVSGLLSKKMGGPPVHPPLPSGLWKPFDGGDKWKTPDVGDPDRYRRSIYTYTKRSIPYPTFATFDAPSREFCAPRRLTSNTPLAALVMLNDTAFVECAEAFGLRMKDEFPGDNEQRLAAGYQLATGQKPSPERLEKLNAFFSKVSSSVEEPNTTWTVVAQVLLNLDDALTY